MGKGHLTGPGQALEPLVARMQRLKFGGAEEEETSQGMGELLRS